MEDGMYRKYLTGLLFGGAVLLMAQLCVRELSINRVIAAQAFEIQYMDESMEEEKKSSPRRTMKRCSGSWRQKPGERIRMASCWSPMWCSTAWTTISSRIPYGMW